MGDEEYWDEAQAFERYPRFELKGKGNVEEVKFVDDGKPVSADTIEGVFKQKGIKIPARASRVFVVEHKGEKKELWLSNTNFTNRRELKAIRDDNNDTLEGAEVKVTRLAEGDPNVPNMKFEKA